MKMRLVSVVGSELLTGNDVSSRENKYTQTTARRPFPYHPLLESSYFSNLLSSIIQHR